MSEPTGTGFLGFLLGKGFFQQVVLVLVMLTVLFVLFNTFEYLYFTFRDIKGQSVDLLPKTITAQDSPITFEQDYNRDSDARPIPLSSNERTGIEFSYSMYLFVHPKTFTGEDTLHHIMHKGYTKPWPLMGPGLFVRGNANTLRVVMNTYKNPYTYMDVENIPIRKWFHLVLICRRNSLEIYINGNLRKKLPFDRTLPYQNFQNLHLFSDLNWVFEKDPKIPSLEETIRIQGAMSGNMSNLKYFAYALSFTEIQSLMNLGVSSQTVSSTQVVPPYLTDTYWTTSYQLQN